MTESATYRLGSSDCFALEVNRRVFVVLQGSAVHVVDHSRFFIKAGDVYVLGVGRTHSFTQVAALTHYNIGFNAELLTALGGEVAAVEGFQRLFVLTPSGPDDRSYIPKLQLSMSDLRRAEVLAEAVRQELQSRQGGCEVVARARFLELVVFLSRRYTEQGEPEVDGLLRLARAAAHIEKHFLEPLSIGELSMLAGMSVSHFSRVFRRHYHTSPGAYVQSLRLHHAAALLAGGDSPVTRVAFASGFSDSNYFARQFRRVLGMSPRDYRRQARRQREPGRTDEV
jgi:AraC-like DNA-binding protein